MWQMLKDTFKEWTEDKVPRLSAALAFYTMLSIAPLLIITLKIVGLFLRKKENLDQTVTSYLSSVSSPQTADTFKQIIENIKQPTGAIATAVSIIILLFSASGVFGELQTSMNEVWEITPRPNRGIMATIKERFFSITLVLGVAFLLLVSLIISSVLTSLSHTMMPGASIISKIVELVVSIGVITCLFALLFKYLPDAVVRWKYVWIGAVVTAVLFTIGKWGLSIYLTKGTTASAFGAMGSLVALLIWVYYSSQIFFFGAELIQVHAAREGHPIRPDETAMRIEEAKHGGKEEKPQETWYPAVPARRELAVAPAYATASTGENGGGGAGSKLLMLAAGVAVGKFLLGSSDKGGKKLAVGTLVEPGFVTRRKHFENKEYVLRFRPPKFVARAADKVQRGYQEVKNRISEYIEK